MQGSLLAVGKCLACLEFMCKYSFGLGSRVEKKCHLGKINPLQSVCRPAVHGKKKKLDPAL